MLRTTALLLLAACSGSPDADGTVDQAPEQSATCDDEATRVKGQIEQWYAQMPPGPPLPDEPRMALLPPAETTDTAPGQGHTLFYDTQHPSGKPVWLLKGRPLAEPGQLPELGPLTEAFTRADAQRGSAGPLILHVPAEAPVGGVMPLLRPLAEQGWTEWHLLTITPAGRELAAKPVAPEGLDAQLDALSRPGPMGPGGAARSQAALLTLYRSLGANDCDTRSIDALLKAAPEGEDSAATTVWRSILATWERCGCAVPAAEVEYLAYLALREEGLRHLTSLKVHVDGDTALPEGTTWGDWVTAFRAMPAGEDGPHAKLP